MLAGSGIARCEWGLHFHNSTIPSRFVNKYTGGYSNNIIKFVSQLQILLLYAKTLKYNREMCKKYKNGHMSKIPEFRSSTEHNTYLFYEVKLTTDFFVKYSGITHLACFLNIKHFYSPV